MSQEDESLEARPPPPPMMTWEGLEADAAGQPNLPDMTPLPTMAERGFLVLARRWHAEFAVIDKERAPPRALDEIALACLLLAVEWGKEFTSVARAQMEANRLAAEQRREIYWLDELPWKLCANWGQDSLTVNLDHHSSAIRISMMELGWFAYPLLNPVEAATRLLKNLADTLAGVSMAAGLAARFFDTNEKFLAFAHSFTPPETFEEQYRDRLKAVEEHGIAEMQIHFWQLESKCRKMIEQAGLGFRKFPSLGTAARYE